MLSGSDTVYLNCITVLWRVLSLDENSKVSVALSKLLTPGGKDTPVTVTQIPALSYSKTLVTGQDVSVSDAVGRTTFKGESKML